MNMDIAGAFAESSKPLNIGGKEWFVRHLDLNDLICLQRQIGSLEAFSPDNFEHLRIFLWLVLRKSDPTLSEQEIENEEYRLTEKQVGKMIKPGDLRDGTITELMVGSGFMVADQGNEEAGES